MATSSIRFHLPTLTRFFFVLGILQSSSLVALAQGDAKVPDPDPELERKSFIVAPGFEVNLFAADPLLAKPIQMNFDPAGRLWVASSETYPQIKPGEKANDKIIILEDTKGVGKADKTTVFADGLLIPTGVEPGDGGAYVANSTELVHLSASQPGGKADRKRILLSGFGTEDTHHIIHTFQWGPDGALYFNQSVYIHSHIETPTGVKRLNAGGIWRYRPQTDDLEVFVRGFWNPWGHAFTAWGQSLITDGANGEGITHGVPGAYYPACQGPNSARILHGLNPGSPKHCGLEVLSGRHLPYDWQGDVLTHDFRGHRVCRFKLQPDGSTFASKEMPELIRSTHPAFRPIDVKMGPDGAIYIADWYNPIIQHGEVDFRDPRRDHTHGRIWRVTAKGRPLVPRPKLVEATNKELFERLLDPEDWTRQQARRVLLERGAGKVVPELTDYLVANKFEATNFPPEATREYLWLCQAFYGTQREKSDAGDLVAGLAIVLSKSERPEAIAAAIRAMSERPAFDYFSKLCRHEDPRVRLEAIRAMARSTDPRAVESALSALDKPTDRVLDYALWLTVRELEPVWMPAFKEGRVTFEGNVNRLTFALQAIGSAEAVKPVLGLIESKTVAEEKKPGLWLLLARVGGPAELGRVLDRAAGGIPEAERLALVQAVEESVRSRKVPKPATTGGLTKMLGNVNAGTVQAAARLVGLWRVEAEREAVQRLAFDGSAPVLNRAAAMDGLAGFADASAKAALAKLSVSKEEAAVRRRAIIALSGIDLGAAANLGAVELAASPGTSDVGELFAAFLGRKGGDRALANVLGDKTIPADVAKIGIRALRGAGQEASPLTAVLTKAGGLAAAKKDATPEDVKARVAEVVKSGDAGRGELVFRRKELQCLACHAIGGAGGQVGPDMTSIGASAQIDYLVESILLPNKAVKEGYNSVRVVTTADRVFLGIKVRETKTELVLRGADDKEIVIPVADIAERQNASSLMPAGLADSLTTQEFADLIRFLSELGKVGPYAPTKTQIVRRWQAIEPTGTNLGHFQKTRVAAAASPTNPFEWSAMYSRVSGTLALADLPKMSVFQNTDPVSVVRFEVDCTTPGKARLKFNSDVGVACYLGAAPVDTGSPIEFGAGVQTVTLVIDRAKRTEDLRVELEDVAGSPARVRILGGK